MKQIFVTIITLILFLQLSINFVLVKNCLKYSMDKQNNFICISCNELMELTTIGSCQCKDGFQMINDVCARKMMRNRRLLQQINTTNLENKKFSNITSPTTDATVTTSFQNTTNSSDIISFSPRNGTNSSKTRTFSFTFTNNTASAPLTNISNYIQQIQTNLSNITKSITSDINLQDIIEKVNLTGITNNNTRSYVPQMPVFILDSSIPSNLTNSMSLTNLSTGFSNFSFSGHSFNSFGVKINGSLQPSNLSIKNFSQMVQQQNNLSSILPNNNLTNNVSFILNNVSQLPYCYNYSYGKCLSCMNGYILNLISNKCVPYIKTVDTIPINIYQNQSNTDINCNRFSSITNSCTECKKNYYLNSRKQCLLLDHFCRTFEQSTGKCTSCYNNFNLNSQGRCILS